MNELNINTDAFSHGQIISKIWLLEKLEPWLKPQTNAYIFGGWYNVLGMMMMVRQSDLYSSITSIDLDPDTACVSDKICNAWPQKITNVTKNCDDIIVPEGATVINCSPEHMSGTVWFDNLPNGTLVCIQSSNMTDPKAPWLISLPNPDMPSFLSRFPVAEVLFVGTKRIQYDTFGYDRYMLVGRT